MLIEPKVKSFILLDIVITGSILLIFIVFEVQLYMLIICIAVALLVGYLYLMETANSFFFGKDFIRINNDFRIDMDEIVIYNKDITYAEVRTSGEVPVIEFFFKDEGIKKFPCIGLSTEDQLRIVDLLVSKEIRTHRVT